MTNPLFCANMEEAIQDLVLAPFQEIVEKGKTAIDNAKEEENQEMLKSAQALVKEGQRALKKIEPLCKKHFDDFASNFVDALKEDGKASFPQAQEVWWAIKSSS